MRRQRFVMLLAAWAAAACAQPGPAIFPRGVTNAFTQESAPAHVGSGGLIQISGSNLGPPEGAVAPSVPWPAQLAGVQVWINGKAAPLGSVSPGTIIAKVPFEAGRGSVEVVVERDSGKSLPQRVLVDARRPSVKTANGRGYGLPAGSVAGGVLTLAASGLGDTDPVAAFIGGIRAETSATASATRPGEFDVQITVPQGARTGDLVNVLVERQTANQTVFRTLAAPDRRFLRLPEGAPEIQFLADTDLNGSFLVGSAAQDDAGCHAAFTFDFRAMQVAPAATCLTSAARSTSPFVAADNTDAVAALAGPPQGSAPALSPQMQIFSPARDAITVDLPSPASALQQSGGEFRAVLPGTPPQVVTVDAETGAIGQFGAGGGAGVASGVPLANLDINVDGLTYKLTSPVALGNRAALVLGDDPDQPTRAKFVMIALPGGDVTLAKDFPGGWMPLPAPVPPRPAGAAPAAATYRVTSFLDGNRRNLYVLSRATGNSRDGFVSFPFDRNPASVAPLPENWFAASCTYNVQSPGLAVFRIELADRIAMVGARVPESAYRAGCTGTGFIYLDLSSAQAGAVPVDGQIHAAGAVRELNDYVYAANYDPSRQGLTADTLYVFDGAGAQAVRLGLPEGASAFTPATLAPVGGTSWLLGSAIDQTAGDQGLVLFDLENGTTRGLPRPAEFDAVNEVAVFPATRRLVARATRQNNANLVIYTLPDDPSAAPEITLVDNPTGVAWVGPLAPRTQGGGGGTPRPTPSPAPAPAAALQNLRDLLTGNPKANTVATVAYGAGGRQLGVLLLRVP